MIFKKLFIFTAALFFYHSSAQADFIASPPEVDFVTQVGVPSATKIVQLTNIGQAAAMPPPILPFVDPTRFEVVQDGCNGVNLNPAQSCDVTIRFHSDTVGVFDDSASWIAIQDQVVLHGEATEAIPPPTPDILINPGFLEFGDVFVGSESAVKFFNIQSVGTDDLVIFDVSLLGGTNFKIVQQGCTINTAFPPGSSCFVFLSYIPQDEAGHFDFLIIKTIVGDFQVVVGGTGIQPPPPNATLNFNPTAVDFGNVTVGSQSGVKIVTLQNLGNQDLDVFTVAPSDPAFEILQETCTQAVIPPQGVCLIQTQFSPVQAINYAATLDFTSSAGDAAVALTGVGLPILPPPVQAVAKLEFSPTALSFNQFGEESLGSQDIVITNVGDASAQIDSIALGGKDGSVFNEVDNCAGQSLVPNASCTITVSFIATEDGNYNAQVEVSSNVDDGFDTVLLFGSRLSLGFGVNGDGCSLNQGTSTSTGLAPWTLMLLGMTWMSYKAWRLRAKKWEA